MFVFFFENKIGSTGKKKTYLIISFERLREMNKTNTTIGNILFGELPIMGSMCSTRSFDPLRHKIDRTSFVNWRAYNIGKMANNASSDGSLPIKEEIGIALS